MVLAGGATAWRDLPIPGRELAGIYQAMEFLPPANRVQLGDLDVSPISAEGKRVVIIGGGDTGADCLGTSHRQGAASVHQFEIMAKPPTGPSAGEPVADLAADLPHRVGPRRGRRAGFCRQHRAIRRRRATAMWPRCGPMRWSSSDGRFVKVEGSEFDLEADLVLLAMGFVGPERPVC